MSQKSLVHTLEKRNEQLKKQDQVIIELKQKLKDKEQECGKIIILQFKLVRALTDIIIVNQNHMPS